MANNRIRFSNDFILKDEKVGINTTEPRAELDVGGDLYVSGIVSATEFVGDGTNLTGLLPNTIEDISVDNIYYPLLSSVTSGTISSISVSSNSIVFNPELSYLGIGTTNPQASVELHTQDGILRFGDVSDYNGSTDNGISFIPFNSGSGGITSYKASVFTEIDGRLLSFGVNVLQVEEERDSNYVGGLVRIDTRSTGNWSDSNVFSIKRQPVGIATSQGDSGEINGLVVNLNSGNTYTVPNGGKLIVGTASTLSLLSSGPTPPIDVGDDIKLQVGFASSEQGAYISGNVGIGTTNPTAKLDVLGHTELDTLNVSIAATIPNLTLSNSGIAVTAILDEDDLISNRDDALATQQSIKKYVDDKLSTEIGDVSLEFSADSGIGTVNLATEIFDIKGTANEIETVGSGATLTIGLPNDVIISNDLTIDRDVLVRRNLEIYGNITIGGTTAIVNVDQLQVKDKDIVLGITTDAFGNDVSTDFTANGGGIAIASTEGSPLVCLKCAGINTFDGTYKQLIWFKEGSFTGLGTDAWLSNYAIGIGSTQVPNGVRLAVGGVQVTDNDIIQISNINASGIITAAQFIGTASTASFATTAFSLNGFDPDNTEVGFARTAVNVIGGIGSITSLSVSGISTLGGVVISSGIITSSNPGVTTVVYYGDGSNLEGVTAFYVDTQVNATDPVYPTLAAGVGVNSVGISTNKLVFIESTSRLGIGTTNPTSTLTVGGDISLVGVETYTTTIQSITATADRYISFPDQTGVVALVQGINGAVQYNNAGYSAGGNLGYGNTTGTFGYIAGGGSVTQTTNKSTGVTLNSPCGRITMNAANLSPGTPVTFTMTNNKISANDLLILNHVSGGTAGRYALNAQCSAGSANINVTNVGLSTLGEAIVIGFAVIKTTI